MLKTEKPLSTLALEIPAVFPTNLRRFAIKNRLSVILDPDLRLRGQVNIRLRNISKGKTAEVNGMEILLLARDNQGSFCGFHQVFQLLKITDKLPRNWEEITLIFPGTIFQDRENLNLLYVLCLEKFKFSDWIWVFKVLTDKFSPDSRIAEVGW